MSVEKNRFNRAPRFDVRLGAGAAYRGPNASTGNTKKTCRPAAWAWRIDRPIPEGAQVQITLFVVEDDVEAEGAPWARAVGHGAVGWPRAIAAMRSASSFSTLTPAQKQGAVERACSRSG